MSDIIHTPIMVKEIIEHAPNGAKLYVDGTAGHGGHIAAIAASGKLATHADIVAVDRDAIMLQKCRQQTSDVTKDFSVTYVQDTYANIKNIIAHLSTQLNTQSEITKGELDKKEFLQTKTLTENLPTNIKSGTNKTEYQIPLIDFLLLDIGVNMEHFKDGKRGFSIHEEAPLDMRFDTRSGETAADLLNTGSKELLVDAFIRYGDFSEKSAVFFYDRIVERRRMKPFTTTTDFVDFLYSIGVRKGQLPVLFQCLRIITNQELEQFEKFLQDFPSCLSIGGRCALITFHSIEDRIAKYAFKALADNGTSDGKKFMLVNKKVIAPHYTEVQKNRASRSAKLRIIERVG